MTYEIDGKRISRWNRPRLLKELEFWHAAAREANRLAETAILDFRIASERADLHEAQRDQALRESERQLGFRKQRQADNDRLEKSLSAARGIVATKDRRVGELERQVEGMYLGRHLVWSALWAALSAIALCVLGGKMLWS